MKIGIISGHEIPNLIKNPEEIIVETPFDDVLVKVSQLGNHDLFFINRHGENPNIPPHKINYLANIQALASSHVKCILTVNTVGSMKKSIRPGDFVIPHDFIDFTKSRQYTFFDEKQIHIDMTQTYCPFLRQKLIESAHNIKAITIHDKGIYLVTEGPRLETVSEIKYFSQFADMVGMTAVPEINLAKEKGMCYASICVVCNMAAGLQKVLSSDGIRQLYKKQESSVAKILVNTINSLRNKRKCNCKDVLLKATL